MKIREQFASLISAMGPIVSVSAFIWRVIVFLFMGAWSRTSFFYKYLYGAFWLTVLSAGLWYFIGYTVGNLNGVEDPWVSYPMFPWLMGIFTGSAGLPHFAGEKLDTLQYIAAFVLLILILSISRYFYPKRGLASGRVSKVQFVAFHVALSGLIMLSFVQYEMPPVFFGMLK